MAMTVVDKDCTEKAECFVNTVAEANYERGYKDGYAKAIEEFYDKALNFEDYIEPLGTSSDGVLMYSGADITRMVVNIRKELMKGE